MSRPCNSLKRTMTNEEKSKIFPSKTLCPKEYAIYISAKDRCTNPNSQRWYTHGARGIKFLFKSFKEFYAELGPKPERYSLERADNNGNYETGNVKWATRSEQQKNKRSWGKGYYYKKKNKNW